MSLVTADEMMHPSPPISMEPAGDRPEPVAFRPRTLPLVRGGWGEQVFAAALRLQGRMMGLGPDDRETCERIDEFIHRAVDLAGVHRWLLRPRRLAEWWTGSRIETCWVYLREAEMLLVTCGANNPRFQQSCRASAVEDARFLPADDPARVVFETATAPPEQDRAAAPVPQPSPVDLVAAIQAVLKASFQQRYGYHGNARGFRNRLVLVTLLVVAIAAGFVLVQWGLLHVAVVAAPGDDNSPAWVRMLIVMLFGALGALITTIPFMAKLQRVKGPYNFPLQQSFMKIAVGSVSGLVGVMVIGAADVATGFASVEALLAAAIVFGAGQQAITRMLDHRAEEIVAAMPKPRPVDEGKAA